MACKKMLTVRATDKKQESPKKRRWNDKLQSRAPWNRVVSFFQDNEVKKKMSAGEQELLLSTGFYHFLDIHPCKFAAALILALGQSWNIEERAFEIGGHFVHFNVNSVALITGFPNRGEEVPPFSFTMKNKHHFQTSLFSTRLLMISELEDLMKAVLSVSSRTAEDSRLLVQLIVWYILGTLIVMGTKHNQVADEICNYVYELDVISSYNWAVFVYDGLRLVLDKISTTHAQRKAGLSTHGFGYVSGFAYCIQVSLLIYFKILL